MFVDAKVRFMCVKEITQSVHILMMYFIDLLLCWLVALFNIYWRTNWKKITISLRLQTKLKTDVVVSIIVVVIVVTHDFSFSFRFVYFPSFYT